MAFSAAQVQTIIYRLPNADGSISIYDAGQVVWAYTWGMTTVSVGGTLTFAGALSRALELYRDVGGGISPTGALNKTLTAYRSLDGSLTPIGELLAGLIFAVSVGGELDLSGDISSANPAWLLLDNELRWMGEWNVSYSYDIHDTVLYKLDDSDEWHVFVSKIGHNVGNIPVTSAHAWRRLYQEKFL